MRRILSEFRKSLRVDNARMFSASVRMESARAIPVMILAAGASRRLGRHKALLGWGGRSLLERVILQARRLTDQVIVVAGCGYPLLRYRTGISPSRWVYNQQWKEGMGTSLARGLESLSRRAPGVLVLLVDQPSIPEGHLVKLYQHAQRRPERAVATSLDGKAVVPAYLPRSMWPALAGRGGDEGARRVLAAADPSLVACEAAAADVDTPEDWRRFKAVVDESRTG